MPRFAVVTVIGLSIALFAGQAMAFQCPKLVKKIEDEIAIRFDPASQDAREKAARSRGMHRVAGRSTYCLKVTCMA